MKYEKRALTVPEQLDQLIARGLCVSDRLKAESSLLAISYYRLSGYFVPFEMERGSIHRFRPTASFDGVVDLYTFDHKLRMLVFDALERIETAFRTQLIYRCSLDHGGWWFEDPTLFYNSSALNGFLEELDFEVEHSKEIFIRHYRETYGDPLRPPAWIAFEVASLGQLSKVFTNLRPSPAKKRIAAYFGLGIPILESWLECLTFVRNTCAHHARLWNRSLVKTPKRPELPAFPIPIDKAFGPGPARFYTLLVVIHYCLRRIGTLGSFPKRVAALLSEYPAIDSTAMGIPDTWLENPFWKDISSPWLL
jgi:abortive infection bacteriophage resistance protein